MLRTSFIMTPITENAHMKNSESVDQVVNLTTMSMYFENRADLYRKLKAGELVEGLMCDFSQVVPHYLMYTTIGRADLVMFESSMKKRKEAYDKIVSD